jgi:two-component system sensor histidine kinase KdpD
LVIEQGPGAGATARAASRSPAAAGPEAVQDALSLADGGAAAARARGWVFIDTGLSGDARSRLAIRRGDLAEEQYELVLNLCGQAGVALDRIRLAEDLESSRREAERARLRSALLTSVSHDLRTPLASIIGAASTVQEVGESLAAADRQELLQTVMDEARRLNGYIQNLLDMTRIEYGELKIQRDWEEPSDLIGAAIRRVRETRPEANIAACIDADVGLVHLHGELFVQALHNVIDNAVRYSPDGAQVEVACSRCGNDLRLTVTDAGPGLDSGQRERIFDMFYRTESGDSRSGGTGLGLAITRGILEAHGGRAVAEAAPGSGGTRIVLSVPDAMAAEGGGRELP